MAEGKDSERLPFHRRQRIGNRLAHFGQREKRTAINYSS
jgi:hypothetical protein